MTDDGAPNPESAFAALGSELRLRILRVIEAAERQTGSRLTFSELYDRIDIESTSQLSYHLGQLDGVFVQKFDGSYGLTQAGERVVRTIHAGTYTERPTFEATPIDGSCPHCASTGLVAAFEDPFLTVACSSCDETVARYDLPPAQAADRSPTQTLQSCDRRVYHELGMALEGTCPTCGGVMDASSRPRESPRSNEFVVLVSCRRCFNQVYAPVELCVFYHPALVAAYWKSGRNAMDVRPWEVYSHTRDWSVDIESTDPFEAHVETDVSEDVFIVKVTDGRVHIDVEP
ncbi:MULTISPECIES: helix-turn-helix transcriptional regulator [Haloferax]|uniref:ArsR family transcriptional regulator n=2 Tax=Haloferax TaxID=2251 RepID=A0A6G1Z6Z0_9EURY|nr:MULTISPECIES: helix-turn-helix domain-containing protein [Haloferax]KAB1185068.1 helix-turn-helix transcriptional regulator [Haloferax sp. CBA1149]MRW82245.1 ArsR family transcriptional regulator [Haloferax marinisediminis]